MDLNEHTASELGAMIAQRKCTAVELAQACLSCIDARDKDVEAWAYVDREHVVAGSREAGAVIMGKTVTVELAAFHWARTRNPHDLERTPGGSSSGSAAAVADHMVPLALGNQTGGSTIRPAAFCGVVGSKPSFNLISRAGMKPLVDSADTVGLIDRVHSKLKWTRDEHAPLKIILADRMWIKLIKLGGWGALLFYLSQTPVSFNPVWVLIYVAIFVVGGTVYVLIAKPLIAWVSGPRDDTTASPTGTIDRHHMHQAGCLFFIRMRLPVGDLAKNFLWSLLVVKISKREW